MLTNDRESWSIANIKSCCADDGVYLNFRSIFTNNAVLGDPCDWSEVDINIFLLDGSVIGQRELRERDPVRSLHVRITRCYPTATNTKAWSEAF